MQDKIPMEDYEKIMDALKICAQPLDPQTGEYRPCRKCYFDKRGCVTLLMMSTHEIMKRMKPVIEKMNGGDGDA